MPPTIWCLTRERPERSAAHFGFGAEDFGLPGESAAKSGNAGLRIISPREVADEVREEQLPVEDYCL